MSKLHHHTVPWAEKYYFHCPGCGHAHCFDVRTDGKHDPVTHPSWTFNGDFEQPTFTPSLHYPGRCHLHLVGGQIQFLPDCKHALAGKTVPMEEFE